MRSRVLCLLICGNGLCPRLATVGSLTKRPPATADPRGTTKRCICSSSLGGLRSPAEAACTAGAWMFVRGLNRSHKDLRQCVFTLTIPQL
jgi:hypothetical protein